MNDTQEHAPIWPPLVSLLIVALLVAGAVLWAALCVAAWVVEA